MSIAQATSDATRLRSRTLGWGGTLAILAAVLAALAGLFYDTVWAMVAIWMRSDTYAHGFVIAPISLWLVWQKRATLAGTIPQATLLPIVLMLPVGAVWLIAHLVDVAVVQQYAFVSLLILAVWAMVGTPVARRLAFPLGFLLFAVPVGAGLTTPMVNFTADFTVGALRLTGIPVYRDGTFFSVPSGDWSVVEACSGTRYLLAAVTLGVLYAYLTYNALWKRLVFVGFSVLVPVLANGVRAYLIVMIAHLSDMKLATGVDHFIYGWVFFGIVITIMFAVGAIWKDPPPDDDPVKPTGQGSIRRASPTALAAVAIGALWAGLGWALDRPPAFADTPVVLGMPTPAGDWAHEPESGSLWGWRPTRVGVDGAIDGFYRSPRGLASLHIGVYRYQRDGAEAVNVLNRMASGEGGGWSVKETAIRRVDLPAGPLTLVQERLGSRTDEHLLVWHWYRVGRHHTANPVEAKLAELGYRLTGRRRDATLIAAATAYREDPAPAADLLADLLSVMLPAVETEIDRALLDPPVSGP